MRRQDREVKEFDQLLAIMDQCDVIRIGINAGEYPYIVPMNFGYEVVDGKVYIYVHGAVEGRKLELLAMDNKVAFEMDCGHALYLIEDDKNCTMTYESVMGVGKITPVSGDDEKYRCLKVLMSHYREDFEFSKAPIPHTAVLKLSVESMSGKRRPVPKF